MSKDNKTEFIGFRLEEEDREWLEKYAEENFEGNMSRAVRDLIQKLDIKITLVEEVAELKRKVQELEEKWNQHLYG